MIDRETGVDLLQQFSAVDLSFTTDLFTQLRRNAQDQFVNDPMLNEVDLAMIKRLAGSITCRRQQFLYWRQHRKKLSVYDDKETEMFKIPKAVPIIHPERDEIRDFVPIVTTLQGKPTDGQVKTESSKPRTTLTETTATVFISPAPTPDDGYSVISIATTARGLDGSRVEFPKLPQNIKRGKDFECPYCQTICPPHYQTPRAWRAHLLRDLRPYVCTYRDCRNPDELFATKDEWQSHELIKKHGSVMNMPR